MNSNSKGWIWSVSIVLAITLLCVFIGIITIGVMADSIVLSKEELGNYVDNTVIHRETSRHDATRAVDEDECGWDNQNKMDGGAITKVTINDRGNIDKTFTMTEDSVEKNKNEDVGTNRVGHDFVVIIRLRGVWYLIIHIC